MPASTGLPSTAHDNYEKKAQIIDSRHTANKCRNYYYLVGFVDGETLCGVVSGIRVGDFVRAIAAGDKGLWRLKWVYVMSLEDIMNLLGVVHVGWG